MEEKKLTRRQLLKQSALLGTAAAGLAILSEGCSAADSVTIQPQPANPAKSASGKPKVVIVRDKSILGDDGINQKAAEQMLGRAVAKLTGKSSGAEAWKSLFKPTDVVGIKVNCLFGKGVSTHPEIAYAVAAGLQLAGVKPENIIIWDRSTGDLVKCGYIPNKGAGIKVLADDGDWGNEVKNGSFHGRLSKILTEKITALVNVPILKTHGMAGISCALKNHYGSFDNPGAGHKGGCNPWLAELNAIPQIKDKTRLVVVDAARLQCDGGPGLQVKYQFDYYGLLVGFDPLAIDRVGLDIIDQQRKQMGREELGLERVKWITTAATSGVGDADLSKIELIKI
ncbi:MAG TPA: DUF362 domain-containing protein [Armatimonadota bacterium]|nr:DUF362 domain-containing protein [Armatimonadota bacterium]